MEKKTINLKSKENTSKGKFFYKNLDFFLSLNYIKGIFLEKKNYFDDLFDLFSFTGKKKMESKE